MLSRTFCVIQLHSECNGQRFETCTLAAVRMNENINLLYKPFVSVSGATRGATASADCVLWGITVQFF